MAHTKPDRGQFTFYASFYDAISNLPKSRQLQVYQALAEYALYNREPTELTGTASAVFAVMRPVLDSARVRARGQKPEPRQDQRSIPLMGGGC